jgi:hypothetical protein
VLSETSSIRLSCIRNLPKKEFEYLIAVIFDENYDVREALLIPHAAIASHASYSKHVNVHYLYIRDSLRKDPQVKPIYFNNGRV